MAYIQNFDILHRNYVYVLQLWVIYNDSRNVNEASSTAVV